MAQLNEKQLTYIEDNLTREDVAAWHAGAGMTKHLEQLMSDVGLKPGEDYIALWGSFDGPEPVSVTDS